MVKKVFFIAIILILGITISLWGLDFFTQQKQNSSGIESSRYYIIAILVSGDKEGYYSDIAKQTETETILDNYWYLTDRGWAFSKDKITLSHLKYQQVSVTRRD